MFWFLWIVVLICAVWVALSALPAGMDAHMPLPYLIALVPLLWVPTLLVAVAADVMGEWGLLCGAIAVGLASQLHQTGYWANYSTKMFDAPARLTASPVPARKPAHRQPTTDELLAEIRKARQETEINASETADDVLDQRTSAAATINVMTLNCRYGRADAKSIVAMVLSRNITVLALQELTDDLVRDLNANGLDLLLPYHQLGESKETDNGGFNGVWIRVDPKDAQRSAIEIPAADVPSITIPVDSMRDITFVSAHPKSPMRGCREWSAGIIGLGKLARNDGAAHPDRDIAVILGDLNSGTQHPSFRALLRSGFTDANLAVAQGPQYTFPRWTAWPRLILDHVLASKGASFTDVQSTVIEGTDHLALTATLTIK
ncbi:MULTISPECIES: endonuclease/exonuclease/phosphatase family protein [Bifidobacterium]|uniref:endonuclease/exonuclease/phosphatase family protein n=1 Tax=Bifidobacterium TaxID=1678 RepID=UPI001BDC99DA|nr:MULTISPECIES: endonuclease/exonuclease/phosphatase family protein [Bifidobacterium]MBT1160329.1 endonuclease/exonuclease/phosphatase family protein [Bifidobacterium sp. SO1]MBW3079266.1 endonuclease/exonuclease/phosphatase family protein [Bifidobacterium simiiventris]